MSFRYEGGRSSRGGHDYERPSHGSANGSSYSDRAPPPSEVTERYPRDKRYAPQSAGPTQERFGEDRRSSYVGPTRTNDHRREYDPNAAARNPPSYGTDTRRDYDRTREPRRDDQQQPPQHDSRVSRYAPYPSPGAARPIDYHGPPQPDRPPGMVAPLSAPPQPYYAPPPQAAPVYPPQQVMPAPPMAAIAGQANRARERFDFNAQFNHGPPKEKSPPSQSVIFMGLPVHTDEQNLRAYLEEMGCSIDGCTIIYDRNTGHSKRYGFARFISTEHARAFLEPAYPTVIWKEPRGSRFPNDGDGLKIKIDYSQKEKIPYEARHAHGGSESNGNAPPPGSRDNRGTPSYSRSGAPGSQGGTYPSSYQPPHHQHEPAQTIINDGARDIGGTPTSILLLRGLDPLTTEQEIALHLQNIPDPSQTVLPTSVRKVMLIKDRNTRGSWSYAFVQFADVQVAVKALSLLLTSQIFPRGFQIRNRVITATFAHEHSFHPVYTRSDWSFRGEGGQELAYWDDKAYASVFAPTPPGAPVATSPAPMLTPGPQQPPTNGTNGSPTVHQPTSATTQSPTKPPKSKEDADADMDAFLSSIDAEAPAPPASAGASGPQPMDVSVPTGGGSDSALVVGDSSGSTNVASGEGGASSAPDVEMGSGTPGNGVAGVGNGAAQNGGGLVAGGVAAADAESKKSSNDLIASKKAAANIQKWNTKKQEVPVATPASTDSVSTVDDFGDAVKMTCLLCQRQFKSLNDLTRHNELSPLHKTNLQDETIKQAARQRKAALLKAQQAAEAAANESKYTDRAAARREAFGQPSSVPVDQTQQKLRYEPAPAAASPPPPIKTAIEETNVGSQMLAKMGWTKGEGLGQGGRVEPITASQYTQGVGLGASTGTTIGQYDDSKQGKRQQLQDRTSDRYNATS